QQVLHMLIYCAENGGTSAEDSSEEDEDKNKAEDDSGEGHARDSVQMFLLAFGISCASNSTSFQTNGTFQNRSWKIYEQSSVIQSVCVCVRLQLEEEGTYECSVTGLVFEASQRVLVRYSVLSWSKFGAFLPNSWKCAGPIFNVDTVDKDASALKSIQFPHSVCLAHPEEDMTFRVLHIKDNRPLLEPTSDHTGSHVKWNVSSLSPVGPILQTNGAVEHHGVVLVYKQLCSDANSYSFHVYLATNSASDIKVSVSANWCFRKNRYLRIDKPPTCKLDEGTYRLLSKPEGEIKPQVCLFDLKFTLAVTKMKGYFEAFFEQPPPFKLSLIEINTEQTVWDATIREGTSARGLGAESFLGLLNGISFFSGDCVENVEKKPRKRTILSKQLGMEWKQVAIFLGLEYRELDDIQAAEKEVNMQKLKMLLVWKKRRRPGEATAAHLLKNLEEVEEVPNEVYQILKGTTRQTYTYSLI
uniref:Si:dkeyp-97b10.3 n=1 Tax=Kryptolebias marmoratus TaxID=37003 RepID=A0A3Q3BCN6_KRYMA